MNQKFSPSPSPPRMAILMAILALGAGTGSAESAAVPQTKAVPPSNTVRPSSVANASMASLGSARVLRERQEAASNILQKRAHRITQAQRVEAARRAAEKRAQPDGLASGNLTVGAGNAVQVTASMTMPVQGGTPNYFGPEPNWAWTPPIHKFMDSLPLVGVANNLGQYIPMAVADTSSYPGSDYYEIGLVEFTEKLHSELNPTTLRGYVQLNDPAYPATRDANGKPTSWPPPQYLGPLIVATKDRPVRVKFYNLLPTGKRDPVTGKLNGDLFLPVDTTEMGAGMGPYGMTPPVGDMNYTQNRGTLHLHGGLTPWISDGTPHQWITPAGEVTSYTQGVSVQNVPDMPSPNLGDGSMTFYYSNQQSARLMFYHDHAYGITRLNVYAGEAAGYVLTDATEQGLISSGVLPDIGIPLIIQDKTFVDPAKVLATDPTWPFAVDLTKNDLWYPHVYMPNQNPNDLNGANPVGRWDYGPWFWPPWPVDNAPITNTDGTVTPNLPNLSMTMEAFMDTPMVNGTPYPYLNVEPKLYRFRILNAANDRMWNLGLYMADPMSPTEIMTVPASFDAVYPANYTDAWGNPVATGTPVPFPESWKARTTGQPGDILDGRESGVPDPLSIGPSMIQIGTEGGFLPTPVVWPNIPIGVNRNPKDITVGNVLEHNLFIGPAERADVLIDFSQYAGKTIILYNDGPAAVPAADSRLDYYTGDLDQTDTGGTTPTLPGYGPNTRTIMQFRVAAANPIPPAYDMTPLMTEFTTTATKDGVFKRSQDPIIVPQAGYNTAYGASYPSDTHAYSRIDSTSLTFTPLGASAPITVPFEAKAIHELFENSYGRMSAFLGLEMKFTNGLNQTTLPFGYIDPPTEKINDAITVAPVAAGDGTQIWKITHNGVDTHPIHFHLFNVQLINRVGWDGAVKPPEPNELGWKETVRMNPLEDCIVALRAVSPKIPFGVPDSKRLLDPTMPAGSTVGFAGFDPNGNPTTTVNQEINFGWEYVWHCHILSHEEMDMMRPIVFNVARTLPAAPVVSFTRNGGVNLTWTDGTPVSDPTTLGNPANEIGYRVLRAPVGNNGKIGTYSEIATPRPLANQTSFTDSSAGTTSAWSYQVVAYNAAGDAPSTPITVGPPTPAPAAPSNLVGTPQAGPQVSLTFRDNATNENGFVLERSTGALAFTQIALLGPRNSTGNVTYNDTTVSAGATYTYRVKAYNGGGSSSYATSGTISVPSIPAAPTGVTVTAVRGGNNNDTVTLKWTDNANNETGFTIQRATNSTFTAGLTSFTAAANATTFSQATGRGVSYYYRIRANNLGGSSAWVNAAPFPIVTP